MIELNNVHDTGRGFDSAVVLPIHNKPLNFTCLTDGPASLNPIHAPRALLGHAVLQRSAKFQERLSLPLSELSLSHKHSSLTDRLAPPFVQRLFLV